MESKKDKAQSKGGFYDIRNEPVRHDSNKGEGKPSVAKRELLYQFVHSVINCLMNLILYPSS